MIGRRFSLCFLCVMVSTAATARGTLEIHEHIVLQEDGSAELTLTVLTSLSPGEELMIPFAHPMPDSIPSQENGVRAGVRDEHGLRFLVLSAPWNAEKAERLRMHIPAYLGWSSLKRADFGNMTIQHTFRNTTPQNVDRYRGDVFLPEGYVVTSILSSLPEQTEKDPVAPFEILEENGRSGVSIRNAGLGMGDGASISFRCKPADKSPILLIVLVLAGALYLIFFRDVLKDNGNGPPAAQNAQS